ncbi:MAG: stomatin-like protein [bacterium]|nr:paraslipin [Planctomycetota bacterium]HIL50969.1 paraslipin [Planctomycetota bacterium]
MQYVVIAFVVVVLVGAAMGLKIVNQAEVMVIERLGKFQRILNPGLNLIFPFIDKPRPILWRMRITNLKGMDAIRELHTRTVDLREQVFDFPKQSVITADNVVIEINGLLYYQVTDPRRAVYEVSNLPNAIEKLAQTTLRNIIGELALDSTLTSRDEINGKMRTVLDEATDKWGVKVNRVEVQDIDPPTTVREAMEMQMRAERERRATILEAEGIKQSKILRAEGERGALIAEAEGARQSRILIAQGEAESLSVVASALEREQMNPADYLIAMKYLATLSDIGVAADGDKTVFLPYEASAALGSLGGLREMFKGGA